MPRKPRPLDKLGDSVHRSAMRTVRQRLRKAKSQEDADRIVSAALEALQKAIPQTLLESASGIADAMDAARPQLLETRRDLQAGFEHRLHRTWQEGLDRLEALIQAYFEFGEKYYRDGFHPDAGPRSAMFHALSQLHARSCRVAAEVYSLLASGFADGANARWRTLHEIGVVAQFIAEHGEATAERYLLHDGIRACKAANRFNEHADGLGWDRVDPTELNVLEENRKTLIGRFGKSFGADFGWAVLDLLGKPNPGIGDLEADIGLAHWRPFYGWASDGVHAGPGGLRPMGLPDHGRHYLLAGPSNAGLADPGQNTALSLAQILSALLVHRQTMDNIAMVAAFDVLVGRCQNAFMRAHDLVESEQRRTRAVASLLSEGGSGRSSYPIGRLTNAEADKGSIELCSLREHSYDTPLQPTSGVRRLPHSIA